MKSHSCLEVRGVVVIVFMHSDCDYWPSKVMPSMEPMGQFDRRPLLVHGLTLSALHTRVELPNRGAEHHEDAPLLAAGQCPAAKCELNYALPENLSLGSSLCQPCQLWPMGDQGSRPTTSR